MQAFVETPDYLSDAKALGLTNMFAKSEKTDLTAKERNTLKRVLSNLANEYRARSKKR